MQFCLYVQRLGVVTVSREGEFGISNRLHALFRVSIIMPRIAYLHMLHVTLHFFPSTQLELVSRELSRDSRCVFCSVGNAYNNILYGGKFL